MQANTIETSPTLPQAGSLVRTRRVWAGGVQRALVSRVFEQGGQSCAEVAGLTYKVSELEVIRAPVNVD